MRRPMHPRLGRLPSVLAGIGALAVGTAASAAELKGTALIVAQPVDKNLTLASRNVSEVALTSGEMLNTYDVLRPDKLVFTRKAFEQLEARLGKE